MPRNCGSFAVTFLTNTPHIAMNADDAVDHEKGKRCKQCLENLANPIESAFRRHCPPWSSGNSHDRTQPVARSLF